MEQRKDMFVLNDFLKFERRLYQFAGLKFGRAIKIKSLVYLLVFGGTLFIWYHIPLLNVPLRLIPHSLLIVAPFVGTYLLTDIGTENRAPLQFFKSFIKYHWRKGKRVTYFKGLELGQPKSYGFGGQLTARAFQEKRKKPNPSYRFEGYISIDE